MSRHRNVRSMRYSDEYDGYDDVYGHSVEEDYSISPSDSAFMYDRSSRQPQISSYLTAEDDIAEEDEGEEDSKALKPNKPALTDIDEAKLRSCLDEVRNVVGDSTPEQTLIDIIIKSSFDIEKSLNTILNQEKPVLKKPITESPKPQRASRLRHIEKVPQAAPEPSPITVVSSPAKGHVVKGFEVPLIKSQDNVREESSVPLSSSPSAHVTSDSEPDRKEKVLEQEVKTPGRNNVKAEEKFRKERGEGKSQLHMVVTGHVDAGKSTLMGHLLYKLGHINSKLMHKYEQESKKLGKQSFMYAWILDETGEERNRGITMDVGQSKFETESKVVTLLDAPGHKDFIPNMITGAAQADVALLVVDSTRGEFETGFESGGQTREHALLVRSLGVNQLCVVVNKLDTVGWSEERFKEISCRLGAFLKQAGFREREVTFVPCSGLSGENLTSRSLEPLLTKWYDGPSLIEVIDKFKSPERPVSKPFRLPVNDIFKGTGSNFCISGRVETGMVQTGDKVLIQPQNENGLIKGITIDDMPTPTAFAGDYVSVTIANYDQQNIAMGYILCDPAFPVPVTSKFEARVVIFNTKVPITKGFPVVVHLQCLAEQAVITKLVAQLNKSTGEVVKRRPRCLLRNTNAVVVLETSRPVCIELYRDMKELGRFMLRVGGATIAAGLVTQIL